MTDTSATPAPTPPPTSREQRRNREATIQTLTRQAARWDALGMTPQAATCRAILERVRNAR